MTSSTGSSHLRQELSDLQAELKSLREKVESMKSQETELIGDVERLKAKRDQSEKRLK